MGLLNPNEPDEDDLLHAVAVEVALAAGLLEECEVHEEVYNPLRHNFTDAYRLANALVTRGHPLVAPFHGNRRRLTDLLRGHLRWVPGRLWQLCPGGGCPPDPPSG